MHHFEYQRVLTLQEAFDAASNSGKESVFMAGGTDLLVKIKRGVLKPRRVVDLKGIPEMAGISVSGESISIGALTTIRAVETSPAVREKFPLLAQAAGTVGSVQVRNRATIGGNLCNAAPSADTAPALLALDARAELCGRTGTRIVDLHDVFSGPGSTILQEGELLRSLHIPLNGSRQGGVYHKLTTRKAMDIAFVGVAVQLAVDGDDRIHRARIALGAVAPVPIRARSAEEILLGERPSPELVRRAGEAAAQACRPITDLRASDDYRKEMVNRLCQKGLLEAHRLAISTKGDTER